MFLKKKEISMIKGVQRPSCAEFCINTEGTPSSGTTEAEKKTHSLGALLQSCCGSTLLCTAALSTADPFLPKEPLRDGMAG